jgi:hypothetical protein
MLDVLPSQSNPGFLMAEYIQLPLKRFLFPRLLAAILLVLAFFPYTPFVFTESYTQPFYLLFSWGILAYILMASSDVRISINSLLLLPLLLLCIVFSLIRYDLNALAVMLTIASTFILCFLRPSGPFSDLNYVAKILHFSIIAWLVLGVIHYLGFNTFLVPSHLASAPEVLRASGRGVLSFAPEPTHYALHTAALIVLKLLCDKKVFFFFLSFLLLLLTSLSSTLIVLSVVSLLLSASVRLFTCDSRLSISLLLLRLVTFISSVVFAIMFFIGLGMVLGSGTRFGSLFSLISMMSPSDFMDSLEFDGSTCARVNGLVQSVRLSFEALLLPHGFRSLIWEQAKTQYCQYSGVGLSSTVPSGYFSLLFVYGIASIPFLGFVFSKSAVNFVSAGKIGVVFSFSVALSAIMPLSQLYFSDPSLLLALLLPGFAHNSLIGSESHALAGSDGESQPGHSTASSGSSSTLNV